MCSKYAYGATSSAMATWNAPYSFLPLGQVVVGPPRLAAGQPTCAAHRQHVSLSSPSPGTPL